MGLGALSRSDHLFVRGLLVLLAKLVMGWREG
jgi:hypothetical protein